MGLFKRDQVWWMRFSYNGKQIRQSTGATDKKLAEKIHAKVLTQITEGKWFEKLEGEEKTVGELLEKYINEHSVPNKRPNTVRSDRIIVKEMEEFFGNTPLKEITPRLISEYKTTCRNRGLSASSINSRRGLLRHAFNLAMREWEWVKENPVDRVSPEKVRNARDRWLTFEEEKTLIDNCVLYPTIEENKTEPRYWLQEVVIFALNTGMRQDEILSLECPHVDLFRKTATVVRSKNGEKRTIPLNQRALELLKSKAKVRSINNNYVFINEAGNKILACNLLRAFYKALKRAKIEDFRFHDLRHTFATRLAQAGIDFYKIGKLLGHKDIRMTQRYAHHYPESLRDGVEILDRISTILAQSNEKGLRLTP
ncbi:MAG: tyrosine-type recombinase/integrase [Deltaproteobacteria bacterium]|nr:tyrosine-type recombinase/integrase [Deltaproteobacteria bacterium]